MANSAHHLSIAKGNFIGHVFISQLGWGQGLTTQVAPAAAESAA
jgi:hypothetical protein